jgi:hypothetical protein
VASNAQAGNANCEVLMSASIAFADANTRIDMWTTSTNGTNVVDHDSPRPLNSPLLRLAPRATLKQRLPDGRLPSYDCTGVFSAYVASQGRTGAASATAAPQGPAAAQGATARPGVLFQSAFTGLADGDFPADLTFRGGGMQINSSQRPGMLRLDGNSWFHIPLAAALPDNFAIEFDYYTSEAYAVLFVSPFDAAVSGQTPPTYSGYRQGSFNFFAIASTSVGVAVDAGIDSLPRASSENQAFTQRVVPVRIEVRGRQARIFVNDTQVVVHPGATIPKTDVVEFFYAGIGAPGNGYVGNIRIRAL